MMKNKTLNDIVLILKHRQSLEIKALLPIEKIKKNLNTVFPETFFELNPIYYSGARGIRFAWENGPSTEQLEQILKPYNLKIIETQRTQTINKE